MSTIGWLLFSFGQASDLSDVLSDNISKLNSYADDNTIIPNTLKLKARATLIFDRINEKPDDMTFRKQLTEVFNTKATKLTKQH